MQMEDPEDTSAPEAAQQGEETPPPAPVRRRLGWLRLFAPLFSFTVAALVFFVLVLALTGRTVPVPEALRAKAETEINRNMQGEPVALGGLSFGVTREGVPSLIAEDVRMADGRGGAVGELNWVGAELSLGAALKGKIVPKSVLLSGAQITVRRTAEGRFRLADGATSNAETDVPQLLSALDEVMESDPMAALEAVEARGVVLTLEDARSGRIWQATNASAILRSEGDALSLSITSDVFNGTDDLAEMQVSMTRNRQSGRVFVGAKADRMPAADIAQQSPILSWLGVLDAPISGAVRAELDADGVLKGFAGTLDIDEGALKPVETIPVLAFDRAQAYFTFDPDQQRIDFTEVSFASEAGELVASGHSYLAEFEAGWPMAYVNQFTVERAIYAGGGGFDGPVVLTDLIVESRLRLDPFTLDVGQLSVEDEAAPIQARGRVRADAAGWHVAVDATTEEIAAARVLSLWPDHVATTTRGWLAENLRLGVLRNTSLGLRTVPEDEPDVSLSFEFQDGLTRFLAEMPLLQEANGRAELSQKRFSLALSAGFLEAPDGTRIDMAGSRFTVPDVKPKPAMGEIDLAASGTLEGILGVLDAPPLRLMERAGREATIASAVAETRALISLPLKDGILAEEVGYNVVSSLSGVESDILVPGRRFEADLLALTATDTAIRIEGDVELDGVPLSAAWRLPLEEGAAQGSVITGRVALSEDVLDVFDVPVPTGVLSGTGSASYELRLPNDPGAPPQLSLVSDLRGIGLGFEGLGWRKPQSARGALSVSVLLSDVPEIEGLSLETEGLSFGGDLDLSASGALQTAVLRDFELGGWLDANVRLEAVGGGQTRVALDGGTLDLRQLELGRSDQSAGTSGPISVRLDRLTVSDGIAISPFSGVISKSDTGLSGTFEGRMNGATPIRGVLSPANAGTSVRITSGDAAGVLRNAGLIENARDGRLDLVLTPVVGAAPGTFDGQFLIEDIRLRDAPAMASLLDAVSVVGLLDQLSGAGIRFDTVDGRFRLNRRQIQLAEAAAVGPSIGISADGIYDLRSDKMQFQGVVSPVYFLNGIGSIFSRRGEGLFGFNYRMSGTAEAPRVGVNPLSILTPGVFRQIFRRPPPEG